MMKNHFPDYLFETLDQAHRPDTISLQGPDPEKDFFSETQSSCVWTTGSYSQPPCQSIRVCPPGRGSKSAHNHPLRDEDVLVHKELGLSSGGLG